MSDILGKFAKNTNSAEGAASAAPGQPADVTNPTSVELSRGSDLLGKVGAKSPDTTATKSQASAEPAQPTVEPVANAGTSDTVDSWTKESALKEVKKLREENKSVRIKYQEQIETIKAETEARLKAKMEEAQALVDAKKELDKIKAEQEDKKRDLSERLAHREAKIAEMQALFEASKKEWDRQKFQMESVVKQFEAERNAEVEVYKSRIDEEIGKIPEKYRDVANLLVKGAGDAKDAYLAISEAKLKGLFEDKTVVVNHSVPGANDGARANKDKLDEAAKSQRASMSSNDKIRTALKQMKAGTPNSAFRTK